MKEYPLCDSCRKRTLTVLPLVLILLVLAAAVGFIGAGLTGLIDAGLRGALDPDWLTAIVGVIALIVAAAFIGGAVWNIRDAQTQVFVSDKGIEKHVFGKPRVQIPWEALAEVGIALESFSGRGGPYFSLYFSICPLTEEQRAIHEEGAVGPEAEIAVLTRDIADTKALAELCPLPLPQLKECGSRRDYDLLCCRRDRAADGRWSEPYSDWLLSADALRNRTHQKQRKKQD